MCQNLSKQYLGKLMTCLAGDLDLWKWGNLSVIPVEIHLYQDASITTSICLFVRMHVNDDIQIILDQQKQHGL